MSFFEIERKPKTGSSKKLTCNDCGLWKDCHYPKMDVTGEGRLKVFLLGEASGEQEDKEGVQFVGLAGALLREVLESIGIDLDRDCWKMNAVNCRPTKKGKRGLENRKPKPMEINCCRPRWKKAIEDLKPEKIILLGKTALDAFLGDRMTGVDAVSRWNGYTIPDQDFKCWVFPTFHPSYIKRGQGDIPLENTFKWNLEDAFEHGLVFPNHIEDIKIITELDEAITYLENLLTMKPEWLSFDYETTGIKPYKKGHEIVSVAFSTGRITGTAMPIFDDWRFIGLLRDLLQHPDIKKTAQNMKFEEIWTRIILGYRVKNWGWDSMEAAHILDNRKLTTGLKFQTYVRYGVISYDDKVKPFITGLRKGENEKDGNRFNRNKEAPIEDILYYNGQDSMFEYRLMQDQQQEIDSYELKDAYDFFHEGSSALADVEERGEHVDISYLKIQSNHLSRKIKRLKEKLNESEEIKTWKKEEKEDFNVGSGPKLRKLLFKYMKYKSTKKTKKKELESVDKEALEQLEKKIPFVKLVMETRRLKTVKNTYVDGILRESTDGYVHPSYNLHLPRSYRSSASNPNSHNTPKRNEEMARLVRRALKPSPGRMLLTADYSGVEVRAGCFYHKDSVMIKYMKDPNSDMHRDTANDLFLMNIDDLEDKKLRWLLRDAAKNRLVFPEFYGDWYKSCAPNIWKAVLEGNIRDHLADNGIHNYQDFEDHVQEVERILWKERFKVYDKWKKDIYDDYCERGVLDYLTGFQCTDVLNRKQAANRQIQGTAFHLLLWSLIELNKKIKQEGLESYIIKQVHDELVFDVIPDEMEVLGPMVRKVMTKDIRKHWKWINVPLDIDAKISEVDGNWYDMKEVEI